jgi:Lar family restriction alleviation protein
MEEIKPLPCPFCGGEVEAQSFYGIYEEPPDWTVECRACDFSLSAGPTREEAVGKWNRRSSPIPRVPA